MAVTFNWIGSGVVTDGPATTTSEWLARIGAYLWAMTAVPGNAYGLYKSADFGITWASDGGSAPNLFFSRPTQIRAVSDKIRAIAPYDGGTVEIGEFDTGASTWGSLTGIGGGLDTDSYTVTTSRSAGPFEFVRADGSRIVVTQAAEGGSNEASIEIKKCTSGGTWSLLHTIQTALFHSRLCMAGMNADHVYVLYGLGGYFPGDTDLMCLVLGSDDSVNGPTTVEADIAVPGSSGMECISTGRLDFRSGEIGVVYAYRAFTDFGGAPEIHAAIGDLSSPLAPTWTAESVAGYTDNGTSGANANVGASFEGGSTLKAYWLDVDTTKWNLYRSERTATNTWTTPVKMFADQSDGSWHGTHGSFMFGFDLLNGWPSGTVGVGILITQSGPSFSVWVGYNGPSFGAPPRNYASTGSLAQAGSYAAT